MLGVRYLANRFRLFATTGIFPRTPEMDGNVSRSVNNLDHFDTSVAWHVENDILADRKTAHECSEIVAQLSQGRLLGVKLTHIVNAVHNPVGCFEALALFEHVTPDVKKILFGLGQIDEVVHRLPFNHPQPDGVSLQP